MGTKDIFGVAAQTVIDIMFNAIVDLTMTYVYQTSFGAMGVGIRDCDEKNITRIFMKTEAWELELFIDATQSVGDLKWGKYSILIIKRVGFTGSPAVFKRQIAQLALEGMADPK